MKIEKYMLNVKAFILKKVNYDCDASAPECETRQVKNGIKASVNLILFRLFTFPPAKLFNTGTGCSCFLPFHSAQGHSVRKVTTEL